MTRYPIDCVTRTPSGRFTSNGGTERDAKILAAALDIAKRLGMRHVTRKAVVEATGLSAGSVSNYGLERASEPPTGVSHIERLRDAVMQHAVDNAILPIIAQGLAAQDPIARSAPEDVKARALAEAMYG